MGFWTTLTRSQLLHDAWRLDTYEGIHLHLSCADLEKGKRSRADPKDSLDKSNFFNSEKNPKNKQRNKKKTKKNKPQTNKQNKTHENYSSEPPPPVLDPCMLDTLIHFRLITR